MQIRKSRRKETDAPCPKSPSSLSIKRNCLKAHIAPCGRRADSEDSTPAIYLTANHPPAGRKTVLADLDTAQPTIQERATSEKKQKQKTKLFRPLKANFAQQ